MRKVVITVYRGVADVTECPEDVEVEIIDEDILEIEEQEESEEQPIFPIADED